MKFTYYGHSCFSVEAAGVHVLFDPFIAANPLASAIDIQQIPADYILLSHGHSDHILDTEAIALRTGAVVIASYEVHEWLNQRGVTQTHPMNTGGKRNFGPLTVKCVVAHHSSSLPDGTYGGNPMGFLIELGGTSFYYSGDTSLTLDMQLIPAWMQPSFAVMPIGDNFTMGLQDALKACEFCKTTQLIGVHFNTFGYITIDEAGSVAMAREAGIKLILPRIGETLDL